MKLLPMNRLGARETADGVLDFGLFLPWVSAANGNRLWVKIIHENDQFLQHVKPLEFELTHSIDPNYGDYWSGQVNTNQPQPNYSSMSWGTPGRYVYRYCLAIPNVPHPIDWIIDPFAREFGIGKLSAITVGYTDHIWSEQENGWKVPPLNDLIVYELMLAEFADDLAGAIDRLDFLADLGVNCLEIMPVSNVTYTVDWGYLPVGYFGIDERFGKRRDFQRFVDEAHQRGLAVIVDAICGHTSADFPYAYVYDQLRYHENPVMGPFAKDLFGRSTDFARPFTQDFFYTVNYYWLDRYHIDGFRYDCVPNYWDGPTGKGFSSLTYHTYQAVKNQRGAGGYWERFFSADDDLRLIQCAEQLEGPEEILEKTYTNSTWQNQTLGAAHQIAHGDDNGLPNLGLALGLVGFPTEVTIGGDQIVKTALQYVENHDHSRLICHFDTISHGEELLREGNRNVWYKLQPYLIGLFTGKGIPMLWQGQEICENYFVPDEGWGRVRLLRPVRWDYFYDSTGTRMIDLVRRLIHLRRRGSQFRSGEHYYYNHDDHYHSRKVIVFHRQDTHAFSLVALNFGDSEQTVPFWFPIGGDYDEELHSQDNLLNVVAGEQRWLTVPSNYGRIWTIETNA